MAAPKIRADYDSLQQVAASFGSQAGAARQSLAQLKQQAEVLQGGDWIGQGADAFYEEMGDQVMPALTRLADALEAAQQSVTQISQLMQQAEAEAARVLRGDGARSGDGAAQPDSFVVAGGPAGGTGARAGAATGNLRAPAGPGSGGAKGPTLASQVSQMVAAENAAVDAKLKDFSPGVRALVKQSPTLRAEIAELQKRGIPVNIGAAGQGGFTHHTNQGKNSITVEQPLNDGDAVLQLAHESSHALNDQVYMALRHTTRDVFVKEGVANDLHNEGQAQFNQMQVRQELLNTTGTNIGIRGNAAAYQQAYDDVVAGKITKAQAIGRMATAMADEHVSVPPQPLYRDYLRDSWEFYWDTVVDEPPVRKPR